jgi:peptide/nickel transport system substrate-binding protein
MRTRNSMLLAAAVAALGLSTISAQAETVVRYGISMADIPLTTGQPDRGAGAYQFSAYTIYDPLVAWEMDVSDRPGKLVPGLATEWKVDDADKKKWRFALRKGVKFHDGSEFNADAVIWNLDKVLNDKAPQFDKRQSAQVKTRLPSVASYAKIDDGTVEITTRRWIRSSRIRCSGSWFRAPRSTKSSARTGTSSPASPPAPGHSN